MLDLHNQENIWSTLTDANLLLLTSPSKRIDNAWSVYPHIHSTTSRCFPWVGSGQCEFHPSIRWNSHSRTTTEHCQFEPQGLCRRNEQVAKIHRGRSNWSRYILLPRRLQPKADSVRRNHACDESPLLS